MGNCLTEKSKPLGVVVVDEDDELEVSDEIVKLIFCQPREDDGSRTTLHCAVPSLVGHCIWT